MPLFSFHLPCPGGAERTAHEKVAAEERKRLRRKRVVKHMECQKRGASLSNEGDEDDEEGSEEEDEGLAAF